MTEKHIHIIGVLWMAFIVAGTAIQLYQTIQDKKTSFKSKYRLSVFKHISKLNLPINLLLISVTTFCLGLVASSMLIKKIYIPGIIGLVLIAFALIAGYYSIIAILLHLQYYRLERNREIEFDTDKMELRISNVKNNEIETLAESEILRIEIHQCSGNLSNPTSQYEFIKFITNSGRILTITSLQTYITNLTDLFRKKNKKYTYKHFNWIN